MAEIIRWYDNGNQAIVPAGYPALPLSYFNLLKLDRGETASLRIPGYESVCVVLSGSCDIRVDGEQFDRVGNRADVWSGKADSVYVPSGVEFRVSANRGKAEVAVTGGYCETVRSPFRIRPEEVEMVDVGSGETRSHRRIFHILGQNDRGRAGNLLISELYIEEGCWAGYPPHKHDEERAGEESAFEEIYHFRFRPESGFGAQIVFQPDGSSKCFMVKDGDTVLIDRGFHPCVSSPGHEGYVLTILVGRYQRSLVQYFDEKHRHLMKRIPGLQAMRDRFK